MRKFLSVLLAMAMMLSLSVTTLAAEDDLLIAPAPADAQELAGKTVILHSNDVHGAVEGYAYIAALKADYEARGAEVILADAGDFSQGTTYVSTTKGADAVAMMNAVGYDVVTLGNHEFDYGYAQLKENMKNAEFKVVCANVTENGKAIFDNTYTYVTKSGLKLGFFGMETPEAQTKANPTLIKGLTFLAGEEMFKCAQKEVDALKDADLVICLSHLGIDNESVGNRSIDMLAKVTGIDLLIDGHSHSTLEDIKAVTNDDCTVNGTKITSTGTALANIGVVVIDDAAKKIESVSVLPTEGMAQDEAVAAAAKVIVDRVKAEYGEVFAKSEVSLNGAKAPQGNRDSETNNGDLICDAMVWQVMQNKAGLTVAEDKVVAITNGGGIRAAINPGDVTKNDINTVLPFGNTVTVVYITGAELLEALEASTYCTPEAVGGFPQVAGIDMTIDTTKAYDANAETYPASTYYGPASINRVTINSINGKAFDEKATYAVVTNDFCAGGGDTYYAFAAASAQFDTGVTLDEAVMAYVKSELKGVIGEEYAEPQGRIKLIVNPFTDVASDAWYYDAVNYCADNGLMKGTSDTTFDPTAVTTRGMIVTMLARLSGADTTAAGSEWYLPGMEWAVANGISDGTAMTDTVTREQLATMLYRYAVEIAKVDTDKFTADTNTLSYEDVFTISDWASEGTHFCLAAGVIGGYGDGAIHPQANATRAEVAVMFQRFCENVLSK